MTLDPHAIGEFAADKAGALVDRHPMVVFEGVRRVQGSFELRADFEVAAGEFCGILGPSGSGKTTMLRLLAGLVLPDDGRILVGGEDVTFRSADKRRIGFVPQNYGLFPHLSVGDNVAYGLRMRKVAKEQRRERVEAILERVGLAGFSRRRPAELSGGQQQRVALARALVWEPTILLLDEPLSALDRALRLEMQTWLAEVQESLGITTIYVTHDQGEAFALCDRVTILNDGRVVQSGAPRELYKRPNDDFVLSFLGLANVLEGTVATQRDGVCTVAIGATAKVLATDGEIGRAVGEIVRVVVRPEAVRLASLTAAQSSLSGTIQRAIFQGAGTMYAVELATGTSMWCFQSNSAGLEVGARVELHWEASDATVMAGEIRAPA